MKRLFATLIALFSLSALAQPAGVIDSVQFPAFLDRGKESIPAAVGMPLRVGDMLRTGPGARLILKLNEGSFVKLGENTRFQIEKAEKKGAIAGYALSIVEGAFRFTTAAVTKLVPRNVSIKVANNATIGIRGTDLWGRGRDDKDIVCLIEGKIEIVGNDKKLLTLDQPLQFFQSTRNAPPESLSFIDVKQLTVWGAETELEPGKGSKADGEWRVMVGAVSRDAAIGLRSILRKAGYPAELAAGKTVTIGKLGGQPEANDLALKLKTEFKLDDVKIGK